jgi:hypothetical protein
MLLKTLATLAAAPALPRAFAAQPALPMPAEHIRCFGKSWLVHSASEWDCDATGGSDVLNLLTARPQEANPRAPIQYALLESPAPPCFTLDLEVRSEFASASLIVVYAWKDPLHFNYVHLSTDTARKQPVHNGVFHVYGGDRVRISSDEGPAALAPATTWTKVRLAYDSSTHLVETWIDGQLNASLRGVDFSLGAGSVGLGSFFNTGSFQGFNLKSAPCRP